MDQHGNANALSAWLALSANALFSAWLLSVTVYH